MKTLWRSYLSNYWLVAATFGLPVILSLMIWWVFSASVVRELPIDVVDLDQSSLSRMITRNYDATPTLQVRSIQQSIPFANTALKDRHNYGYVIIPANFEKDVLLGKSPKISGFYNAQYILIAKQISSALLQTDMTIQAQLSTIKTLSTHETTWTQAINTAVPINVQITPLFNLGSNYNQFLLSAILPAIWQMAMIVGMIWAMNNAMKIENQSSLRSWFDHQTKNTMMQFVGFYFFIFMFVGSILFVFLYKILGFPFLANIPEFLLIMSAMTLACISLGVLIAYVTNDIVKAMSISGAYTAPSFAFLGVTFPVTDMNTIATFWHSILPASHFVRAQIEQTNYGYNLIQSIPNVMALSLFLVPLLILTARLRKSNA
ncbi:ABC transporter permease [Aliivibrio logei]|nr:ABC transporter permease [Aliivibrio logei]